MVITNNNLSIVITTNSDKEKSDPLKSTQLIANILQ